MTLNELVELLIRNDLDGDTETPVFLKEGNKLVPLLGIESYTHSINGTSIFVFTGELE